MSKITTTVYDFKDFRKGSRAELSQNEIKKRLMCLKRAIGHCRTEIAECNQLIEALEEELIKRTLK